MIHSHFFPRPSLISRQSLANAKGVIITMEDYIPPNIIKLSDPAYCGQFNQFEANLIKLVLHQGPTTPKLYDARSPTAEGRVFSAAELGVVEAVAGAVRDPSNPARCRENPQVPILRRLLLLHNETMRANVLNRAFYAGLSAHFPSWFYFPVPRFRFGWSTGARVGMRFLKVTGNIRSNPASPGIVFYAILVLDSKTH